MIGNNTMNKTRKGQAINYANHNTGCYNASPGRGPVDSRGEEGTRVTSGAMEPRENKEPMGTTVVTTREPTVAAGGSPGRGQGEWG